jgi:hypothetical protein
MPTYVSNRGVWHPAKEKVGLVNKSDKPIEYNGKTIQPGEPFVYEGPDREAIKELHLAGRTTFGQDFKTDPEFLQMVRNRGFQSVEEYLSMIGYDEEKAEKEFEERAAVVQAHEVPKRHAEIKMLGGGKDTSGNRQDLHGGFGEERLRTPAEVNSQPIED